MLFIFTKRNVFSSKLIQWGLGTNFSHFAIAEANICDAFVLDSTLKKGVSIQKLCEFKNKHNIVCAFEIPTIDIKESQRIFTKLYNALYGKKYDYKGVIFLAFTIFWFKKIFRRPLPKENKWADKNTEFCSEILNVIEDDLKLHGIDFYKYSNQMITPDIAYNELSKLANVIYIENLK